MLLLAKHVFVCSDGISCVLLDTRRDRYCLIAPRDAEGLADIVPGWPVSVPGNGQRKGARTERAVRDLLRRGILTTDSRQGKGAWPVALPTATSTVWAPADPLLPNTHSALPGLRTIVRFVRACLQASALLKWRSLEQVLHRHASRQGKATREPADKTRLQRLVDDFRHLRPLFFTSSQHCLFSSLALAEFLALHGLRIHWVFGVQFSPFAAHCWLQQDAIVLNDNVEHVRRFTPIMAS